MNNKIDQFVLVHLLSMVVCNQEGNIVTLMRKKKTARFERDVFSWLLNKPTSTGFLRKITKLSALIIKKRENL